MKVARIVTTSGETVLAQPTEYGTFQRLDGNLFERLTVTEERVDAKEILAPLDPATVYCIGLNYRKHAEEGNMELPQHPVLFMKSPSSVIGPDQAIKLPRKLKSDRVDYECELAVVIGRRCLNVSAQNAFDYVWGYTCANDVSARDWQLKGGGGQWCRGKTFDTFCPIGPHLVTADEIDDPQALGIRTHLNGEVMQDWTTSDMIFSIAELIEFLSSSTTLLPGTLILTGTPHGVGFARKPPVYLQPGDTVTIEIDQIGSLTNSVEEETF